MAHLLRAVAIAGYASRRQERLEQSEIVSGERSIGARERVIELRARPGADERDELRLASTHPSDGELRGRHAPFGRKTVEPGDDVIVALRVVPREARQIGAEIPLAFRLTAGE